MGSSRRICRTLLWLLAFSSLTDGSQLQVMSAPNLLRVGTAENIFVECQDCTRGDIRVQVSVMNHPTKTTSLTSTSVTLTSANNFQELAQITIPSTYFSKDLKQYVYLRAQFPDRLLEKVVLVSFQSSYIFVQTDKTLYTPSSIVHYRIFAVTPRMEPVDRDTAPTDIETEIVNPEGIILPLGRVSLRSGIYAADYRLDEIVSTGVWQLVAKFSDNRQESYSADFEVKEYVLPSYEVKLAPVNPFFYVDSQDLTVNIKATYLFGEEVAGMAFVIFGVILEGRKTSFPSSLQRVPIQRGNGLASLNRQHITQTFPNILELVGSSIFVTVSVLTESGGEMVEAELRDIQIVTSPYTINFKKTPKYFKPGMTFDIKVEVVNPDDTPAQYVPVLVYPGDIHGLTAADGIARFSVNTATSELLTITARTNDPHITGHRQASATMVARPHSTQNNNFIHISVNPDEVMLGTNLKISLILNRRANAQNEITYLILSRGQLVKYGRYGARGQVLISFIVPVTKEMLPSFRIVAYYHTNGNEVVSDSVWVDVKDSCMGSLKLESSRPVPSYEPRRMFGLKVTGDPGTTVLLVAVDKGVYALNDKHRLTQKKVWDIVENYDTGCTPGGGRDSMSVFYDAGLLFVSSASSTPYRQDLMCPLLTRKKRSSFIKDFGTSSDEDSYMDSDFIVSRSKFPESWLLESIKLPACPHQIPNCVTTSLVKNVPMPDSLTTWQLLGIGLSRTDGICVSDPLEVIVRKYFFIDLRLPYSAVYGEELEIEAVLHNYSPDQMTVRVDLLEEEHVCSAASKRRMYRQEVELGPETTRTVPFIIIPMRQGRHRIQVKAAVKDSWLSDGVMKILRVVPQGVLVKSTMRLGLDPRGAGGKQEAIINSEIPLKDLAPNTPRSTIISVTGREQISALVEDVLGGSAMGSLIYQPYGSGESNMIHMTLPVIATTYLDKTNQWETVGFEKRNDALKYIRIGYQNQLAYRKNDGSFAVFSSDRSSTWLTAYVAKVFAMANNLVPVQESVICDAVKFLILNTQAPDGAFREAGRVILDQMRGDVHGVNSDASMTAFCLIAMQETLPLCVSTVNSLPRSIDKAVRYLEAYLPHLTNPYAAAMTSYALANENKLNREILNNFVSSDLSYWPVTKGHIYTLEATAYALLALVKAKAFEDARPVVRWLNQQQKVGGGYGSTQATIMVYQAVAEYWANAKEPDYNLNVDILLPGRSKPDKYNFNRDNHYATRTTKFSAINKNVTVMATGSGEGMLTMVSMYYALPKEKESHCHKFNLSVQFIPVTEDERTYKLAIETLYLDKEHDSVMSILDIGLLTGFTVNTRDLDLLSRGRDRTIAKYDMDRALSKTGSLIIYLDTVSHTRPQEIRFRVHQTLKVGLIQPAAVSIYNYYEPEARCVKFYHPAKRRGEIMRLCKNDECVCVTGLCAMQKKGMISSDERIAKVDEITPASRIDFAYKVRVENFADSLSTDIYTVRIMDVIKEGSSGEGLLDKLCTFLSQPHCREGLDLKPGKTYLIMGSSKDIQKDQQSQLYEYPLSDTTWVEYWPTEAECQTVEYRPTCLGMEHLTNHVASECLFKGMCGMQRKGIISSDERTAKVDEVTPSSRIDLVYKVRVERFTEHLSGDIYTVRIMDVLKDESYDEGLLGKLCDFLSHQHCRAALDLKTDKTYLFMGSSTDMHKNEQSQSYRYKLSEGTWIEYWPTEAECQTEEHSPTCLGIKEVVKHAYFQCLHKSN